MYRGTYEAHSILTPTGGFLGGWARGYTHSLNPAIGCPFGRGFCGQFCYARLGMAHAFHGEGRLWGEYVLIKQQAAELLERELRRAARRHPRHRHHVARLCIFASSSTDPCAPPMIPVFRGCLRVLAEYPFGRIVIQTRSPKVLRLRNEIEALAERAIVSFTLETDSDEVWSLGPCGSPSVASRRRTIEQLAQWPTRLHVAVSPCLPLRDAPAFADWIAEHADDATVDTFTSGDGSCGARTGRLPLPQLLERGGWDWRDQAGGRELLELLRERMGPRVGFSGDGFSRLAELQAR